MLRRSFSILLALLALAAAVGARASEERPNVVLVVWDDPEPQHLGFLGQGGKTPNLDALVASGTRFDGGTQVCTRGRATTGVLLTGHYPHQSGLTYQTGPKKLAPEGSLPQLLHAAGYATLHVAKFREGPAQGFGFDRVAEDVLERGSDEVASFVAEHAGKQPLFVWWTPQTTEAYGAPALDRALGELLAALDAHGERERTLFAFLTNGEPKGREFSARECSQARMQNPLALVWSGKIPAGARDEPVTPLDLFPTLLDYAGVPAPEGIAGRSLRPCLSGQPPEERPLFGEFFELQPGQAARGGRGLERDLRALTVRAGRWKYALFLADIGVKVDPRSELVEIERSSGDQSLFDLEADPEERADLFADPEHAARLAELRTAALEWWHASGGAELTLPFLPPVLGPPPREPRPNIVLVVADDMDYEHLGFMGNPRVRTPTLDALAREGFVFPVAHVPMSRCRPSLASLLSGRWPHQTGIYENESTHTLTRRDSLPNLLKAAGYATFQGGKFWEGSQLSMGFLEPKATDAIFKTFVRESQSELFAFIDRYHTERPLFIWWAPMLPHGPFEPPERFARLFAGTEVPVPAWVGERERFQAAERTAYAMGAWLDDGLAALRAKLEAQGELADTLFVFLIDNGYANGFPSKGTVFEKGLRTPVFFSWPKKITGERTSPALVSSLDLYGTILDYAGVTIPAGTAGESLRPTLEGREQLQRTALYGAVYRYRDRPGAQKPEKDVYALYARTARWKFVLYLRDVEPEGYLFFHEFAPFPARARGERDLFDLEQDPYEQRDLAADPAHAALVTELLQGCLSWWQESGGGELDLP
jgi:uncharacterized sulfatase